MKKILICLSIAVALSGCQSNHKTDMKDLDKSVSYCKDSLTGLCFGSVNSADAHGQEITSITCVPCDSLKNVKVTIIHSLNK